jgi:hypothetical protein
LCWAACILLLPPHGLVLETCSRSRSAEKIDDKESLTPNWLLSALGQKFPNPKRRQLWLFFSTSEPHHQNPSVQFSYREGRLAVMDFVKIGFVDVLDM